MDVNISPLTVPCFMLFEGPGITRADVAGQGVVEGGEGRAAWQRGGDGEGQTHSIVRTRGVLAGALGKIGGLELVLSWHEI